MLQDSVSSWKAFSASHWLWENSACRKLLRCLKSGSQLARERGSTVDEAKLCGPICSPSEAAVVWQVAGVITQKNLAHSDDQWQLQVLQVLKHLFNLLSILLRGNGFARIQKAVVDQTGNRSPNSDHDHFWLRVWLWEVLGASPLPLASLLFSAICKAYSDKHFDFLHFFFLGMVLITASCTMSWTSIHSSSGTLSIRSNPLNLFVTSTV